MSTGNRTYQETHFYTLYTDWERSLELLRASAVSWDQSHQFRWDYFSYDDQMRIELYLTDWSHFCREAARYADQAERAWRRDEIHAVLVAIAKKSELP